MVLSILNKLFPCFNPQLAFLIPLLIYLSVRFVFKEFAFSTNYKLLQNINDNLVCYLLNLFMLYLNIFQVNWRVNHRLVLKSTVRCKYS